MNITEILGEDFSGGLLIAVFSVILGYFSAYGIERTKARREPRQLITWELEKSQGLFEVKDEIRPHVRVLYRNAHVQSLTVLRCNIVNSGNRAVKNEQIRFTFPDGVRLLDNVLDPAPERELGVERSASVAHESEVIYQVGQLEVAQRVGFQFILDGTLPNDWSPMASNPDGDVAFRRREFVRHRGTEDRVHAFILYLILLLITAPMYALVSGIYSLVMMVLHVVLAVLAIRNAAPTARVAARVLCALSDRKVTVDVRRGTGGVMIGNSNQYHDYNARQEGKARAVIE